MADQDREHDDEVGGGGTRDALEAELASFRPRAISPGLRPRIGSALADVGPASRIRSALAGAAAAAACIAFLFVLSRGGGGNDPVSVNPPVPGATPAHDRIGDRTSDTLPPTVIEYRRAFAASPDALDELLARPAGRGGRVERSAPADVATAFTRSATLLNDTANGDSL